MKGITNLRTVQRNIANKSRNGIRRISVEMKLHFKCSTLCWYSYIPSDVMLFLLLISRSSIVILCLKFYVRLLWKPEAFVIIIWNQQINQKVHLITYSSWYVSKVKVLPIQATKALRVGRGIALPFLRPRHWNWGGWWSKPRPGRFTCEKDPVLIVQEAGLAPGPVWTSVEKSRPHQRDSIPWPSSP